MDGIREMEKKAENSVEDGVTIKPEPGKIEITFPQVNLWIVTGTFAPSWYEDAKREAAKGCTASKRREIIFSICFLEAYFPEWVRDDVLEKNYKQMAKYFFNKNSISYVWQEVAKNLKKDKKISDTQKFDSVTWKNFTDLLGQRNWICHGVASRPIGSVDTRSEKIERLNNEMRKNRDNFNNAKNGDSLKAAVNLVTELHKAAGNQFSMPEWIENAPNPKA